MFSLNLKVTFISFKAEIKLDCLPEGVRYEEEDVWSGMPCYLYGAGVVSK